MKLLKDIGVLAYQCDDQKYWPERIYLRGDGASLDYEGRYCVLTLEQRKELVREAFLAGYRKASCYEFPERESEGAEVEQFFKEQGL